MSKIRKAMIVLECLIAVLGMAAGICKYITEGNWQVIAWAIVLACACWRSAVGQRQIARMEEVIAALEVKLEVHKAANWVLRGKPKEREEGWYEDDD